MYKIPKQSKLVTLLLITLTVIPALIAPLSIAPAKAATETESNWSTLASMPTARSGFGVGVVAGKIFVIGGINENNQPLSIVEEYDPITDAWTSKMSMPTPRGGLAVAVYNNKIYAIGGTINNGYVGNNEMYDPETNTWTPKSSMPTPRSDLSANVVNDGIYLIGGKRYSSESPYFIETGINEYYNPETDSWSTKTPLPTGVQGYASAVYNSIIYLMGGSKKSTVGSTQTIVNLNQMYNTQTDQWTQAAPMPTLISYAAAAATTGNLAPEGIYLVGGVSGDAFNKQVRMLSLSNNSWINIEPMPTARGYLAVAVMNDELYVIGGYDGSHWLTSNEKYTPLGYGTVPPKVQITSPENNTYRGVTLDFALNRGIQWMGYSLDGQANVTVIAQTELTGLPQGAHNIKMYANDSAGNMGVSNTVYFTIDTIAPSISILAPANQSYGSNDIQLSFTVDKSATTLAYYLDGQAPVAIVGNISLVALSNGGHRLTLYATDDLGNVGQETVYFNIEPFPFLTVVAILTIAIIVGATGFLFVKKRKAGVSKQMASKINAEPKEKP